MTYLSGDTAKRKLAEDAFGLDRITASLATVLLSRIAADGYVVGIEGEWGSGKTSLINFVVEKLKVEGEIFHQIIRFDPWLIGTKEALLKSFFSLLIEAIREFGRDPTLSSKLNNTRPNFIENAVSHIAKYAASLDKGIGSLEYAAAIDPTGKSKVALASLKFLVWLLSLFRKSELSLERQKSRVRDDLQTISNLQNTLRITVVIDDLDRLEPSESVEILRLIKAVADFPMLTYLVCFDRKILTAQVKQVLGVEDGHDFIEKIFQNIVPIPPQEPFALRRYVQKLLAKDFPEEFEDQSVASRERKGREQIFFDVWVGKFVLTPRDAVRLSEAIKLGWPFLRGRADFIDYFGFSS